MDADLVRNIISAAALAVAAWSLFISHQTKSESKKKELVAGLLGEKESVFFTALKVMSDGLSSDITQRKKEIRAIVTACIFEGSDRARSLLFAAVLKLDSEATDLKDSEDSDKKAEKLKVFDQREMRKLALEFDEVIKKMACFNFAAKQLDLTSAMVRLQALKILLKLDGKAGG